MPVMDPRFFSGILKPTDKPMFSKLESNPRKSLDANKNYFRSVNINYEDEMQWPFVDLTCLI